MTTAQRYNALWDLIQRFRAMPTIKGLRWVGHPRQKDIQFVIWGNTDAADERKALLMTAFALDDEVFDSKPGEVWKQARAEFAAQVKELLTQLKDNGLKLVEVPQRAEAQLALAQ